MPSISESWEACKVGSGSRAQDILKATPVFIDYEVGEETGLADADDDSEGSDREDSDPNELKEDFIREFALSDSADSIYLVVADVIRPLPE